MSTVVSTAAAPNAPVPDQEFETVSMVLHIFTKDRAQMPFAGDQISLRLSPGAASVPRLEQLHSGLSVRAVRRAG